MDTFSWSYVLTMYLRTIGWAFVAAISFSFGIGLALKVFTWLTDIDEWKEIKNRNIGVSLIILSIIIMVGLLLYKVI